VSMGCPVALTGLSLDTQDCRDNLLEGGEAFYGCLMVDGARLSRAEMVYTPWLCGHGVALDLVHVGCCWRFEAIAGLEAVSRAESSVQPLGGHVSIQVSLMV